MVNGATLITNAQNGLSTVEFNGTDQYINYGNLLNIGTNGIHIFSVTKYNSTGNGIIVSKASTATAANRWWFGRVATDGGTGLVVTGAATSGAARFVDTSTSTRLLTGTYNRSTILAIENGTTRTTTTYTNAGDNITSTYPLFVACYPDGTGSPVSGLYFGGQIMELIVYIGTVSSIQRQQIEGYLAWKWGLSSNLPTSQPFRTIPPVLRPFYPLDVPGCSVWIDAADGSTVTLTGSNVTQLRDKSSNAYIFSNATGYTYNITQFQDKYPSFYLATTSSGPHLGSNTSISLTQPVTFFTVCSIIDTVAGGYIFDSTTSSNRLVFTSYTPGQPVMFAGAELKNTVTNSFVTPAIHGGTFNGTTSTMFLNGTLNITGSAGTQRATGLIIGSRFNLVQPWTGHICELLIYNSILSSNDRQAVEAYLADKWGLRGNLPSTHSLKLYKPLSVPFSPIEISTCSLWLDGADSNTLDLSGNSITRWKDKSGNSNDATGYQSPSRTTINGVSAIALGGSNNFDGRNINTSASITVFAVASNATSTGYNRLISLATIGAAGADAFTNNYIVALEQTNNNNIGFERNFGSVGTIGAMGSNPFLVCTVSTTTSTFGFLNGTAGTSNTYALKSSFNYSNYSIGRSIQSGFVGSNPNWVWPGSVGEVIVYNSLLTTGERQEVEGYLAWKWGLSRNLPTTHPYYKFNPS